MTTKAGKVTYYDTREYGTLTNYQDKFIILTGGTYIKELVKIFVVMTVLKYDIKRNIWSHCPPRRGNYERRTLSTNHSSVSLNGKIFLFFGEEY